jgi:hypothetical protein
MAVLAGRLIEVVAGRVLMAMGAVVAGGAAAEAARERARKRQEEAERARSAPLARTEALSKAKEKCKECPPDRGTLFNRNTSGWSDQSISYQMRIGGMPAGPSFITEWTFDGTNFDGFDSSQCLLKEAKARYDQFFDKFGDPEPSWNGDEPLIVEATTQSAKAKPQPPVQLRWHFMQPLSYRFFSRLFTSMMLPIETVWQP